MRNPTQPVLVLIFAFQCLWSVQAADLKTYNEVYQKELENILQAFQPKFAGLQQQYRKSLETLKASAQNQGDLTKIKAALAEIERFKKERTLPAVPDESAIPVIKSFQSDYVKQYSNLERDMTAQLGTLTTKYEQALERLQKELVRAGKLDEASAVEQERGKAKTAVKGYTEQLSAKKELTAKPDTTVTAAVTEPATAGREEISKAQRLDRSEATAPFNKECSVQGSLLFCGESLHQVTDAPPTFSFRNEENKKFGTGAVEYSNGTYWVSGLSAGSYYAWVDVNANMGNPPKGYPGDYTITGRFKTEGEKPTNHDFHLQKVIHLITPEDNNHNMSKWNNPWQTKPLLESPVSFSWEAICDGAVYEYSITRYSSQPYRQLESLTSGKTSKLCVSTVLSPSADAEHYQFTVSAFLRGEKVGILMTHGDRGYGWDYRFRIQSTAAQASPPPVSALPAEPPPTFSFSTNNGAITLTKYTGAGGAVIIPSTINGFPVIEIGESAFWFCTSVTSVVIPDGVTTIGPRAFRDCLHMVSVTVPGSVRTIGGFAFRNCPHLAGIYFQGDVPALSSEVFPYTKDATIYYLPGSKGWGKEFGGRPTAVWKP